MWKTPSWGGLKNQVIRKAENGIGTEGQGAQAFQRTLPILHELADPFSRARKLQL